MGIYNFEPRFVQSILSGAKTHTIRAVRIHPDKPGNTLHLYTGLRTKKARLLIRVPCVKIEDITIADLRPPAIWINDEQLSYDEEEALARRDGFSDFAEMIKFWREPKNRLPFRGHIIYWLIPKMFYLNEQHELCSSLTKK